MSRLVEDAALRRSFKEGQREALAEVYRHYASGVYRFVQNKLRTAQKESVVNLGFEVDNLVQETFLKAFAPRARGAYDGLRPYRNYLYTIAQNLIIDAARKKKWNLLSIDAPEHLETHESLQSSEESAESQVLHRELAGEVKKFCDALPEVEQRLFHARFSQGLSVEACAEYLGISEYRVKRDEKRLRQQFFKRMRSNGYFEGYRPTDLLILILVLGQGIELWSTV